MPMNDASFVVSLCPFDHKLYRSMLNHHYRAFGKQVSEFLIVYDENPDKIKGDWQNVSEDVKSGIHEFSATRPNVRLVIVPYEVEAVSRVASFFVGKSAMPLYDFRGYPIYAFFYSLFAPRSQYVFHLDSDMLIGGMSQTWISEAMDVLRGSRTTLTVSPHPGPPHPRRILKNQKYRTVPGIEYAFVLNTFSTRVFLVNTELLRGKVRLLFPSLPRLAYSIRHGFPACDTAERAITKLMARHDLQRIDFLGRGDGMWSLHPQRRSDAFFDELPAIIRRVEMGDVPEDQMGYYNFSESFFDWRGAYKSTK